MRRFMIAVGTAAGLVVGGAVAADAAPKNTACVTVNEFAQVREGQSKAKVAKIFGTKGKRKSITSDHDGATTEWRTYKVCKMVAAKVTVTFGSGENLPTTKVGYATAKSWDQRWERPSTVLS